MRFRAEAYQIDTEDLIADLGHWESLRDAKAACMAHALEPLTWEQLFAGYWKASADLHWYKVIATRD